MKTKLKFTFKYAPRLVESKESHPRICFWISRDAGYSFAKIDPQKQKHYVELEVDFGTLSADSTLSFQDFVDTKNSRNEPSSNEAGSNFIYLKDVIRSDREVVVDNIPLVVFNARRRNVDAIKGVMSELRFEPTDVPQGIAQPFQPIEKHMLLKENQQHIVDTLVGHLKRQVIVFEQLKPTLPSLSKLHLPTWDFNSWRLPGAAFAMVRAKPSPEAWWMNALDIALRRHYPKMSLEGASSYMMNMADETELVTIMSKMHSIFINHCTYLSDGIPVAKRSTNIKIPFVSNSGQNWEFISMEAFSNNIRSRGAPYEIKGTGGSASVYYVPPGADCEDGGAEQGFEAMELRNRTDWTDSRLKKLHEVRQKYFYLQVLMGVRGAKASDGKDEGSNAYKGLGGHMAGSYISREQFFEYHKRFNTVAEPYEGVAQSGGKGQRSFIQFLEGTGLIDPGASPQYTASMRSYIYLNNIMPGVLSAGKFMAPQSRNPAKLNKFYRWVQSYCVLDLADEGHSALEHVPLKRVNGEFRTGVSYLDFINAGKDIASFAQPPMDEDTVRITKQLLNQMFPIQPFEVPERLSAEPAHHEDLEAVKQYTEGLRRPQADAYDVVQIYLRFDQLNSVKESYMNLIKRANKVFKFRYYNEEITKGFGGVQVRFYVALDNTSAPIESVQHSAIELLGHPHFHIIEKMRTY
jgi:hypothetical protein